MSKLPKAPLIEVIFELRWKISNQSDLEKYQFLTGDIYSSIKKKFPHRKLLVPPDIPVELLINKPTYRYSSESEKYPLVQFGPGLLSLHTDDENYFWSDYSERASSLTQNFLELSNFSTHQKISPSLIYIDFLEFDLDNTNIINFINENLKIYIKQELFEGEINPNTFNFGFSNEIELGTINLSFNTGQNKNGKNGLVIQTKLNGENFNSSSTDILSWLNSAHDLTSKLFKKMTEGKLYDSFKNKL